MIIIMMNLENGLFQFFLFSLKISLWNHRAKKARIPRISKKNNVQQRNSFNASSKRKFEYIFFFSLKFSILGDGSFFKFIIHLRSIKYCFCLKYVPQISIITSLLHNKSYTGHFSKIVLYVFFNTFLFG